MTQIITPELHQEISLALRKYRAPSKVAKHTGIDIRLVLVVADEFSGLPRIVRQEQFGGHGPWELQQFSVGRKKAWEVWDNADPAIAAARDAYEAGTHDMVTGRDGDWLILYSIPQRRVTPRPAYFQPEV